MPQRVAGRRHRGREQVRDSDDAGQAQLVHNPPIFWADSAYYLNNSFSDCFTQHRTCFPKQIFEASCRYRSAGRLLRQIFKARRENALIFGAQLVGFVRQFFGRRNRRLGPLKGEPQCLQNAGRREPMLNGTLISAWQRVHVELVSELHFPLNGTDDCLKRSTALDTSGHSRRKLLLWRRGGDSNPR